MELGGNKDFQFLFYVCMDKCTVYNTMTNFKNHNSVKTFLKNFTF